MFGPFGLKLGFAETPDLRANLGCVWHGTSEYSMLHSTARGRAILSELDSQASTPNGAQSRSSYKARHSVATAEMEKGFLFCA